MENNYCQFPQAFNKLHEKLDKIERLLLSRSEISLPEEDKLLTIKQAAEFLVLSVPTIYGLVQRHEVPVCKRGKRLYFSKQDLTSWIKDGRKKTNSEIEAEAHTYLLTSKNRR